MIQQQNGIDQRVSTTAVLLPLVAIFLGSSSMFVDVDAFHPVSMPSSPSPLPSSSSVSCCLEENGNFPPGSSEHEHEPPHTGQHHQLSRRGWLSRTPQQTLAIVATAVVVATSGATVVGFPELASASDDPGLGIVTDRVFVDVSGLSVSASAETGTTQRIVLGLFGKDAPSSVNKLKLLHDTTSSVGGLAGGCKPLKDNFLIQREQLEANKIYRSCLEGQDKGVTYDYAQIWRIIKDERVDFGSLSGRFNAREYPTWAEKTPVRSSEYVVGGSSSTTNSASSAVVVVPSKYLVAVRKGSDSGFGYTLFPTSTAGANDDFLENFVVVGSVLEGEDVVDQINNVSVVVSAKGLNYMSIVGGGSSNKGKNNAPKKDCRYGGPMYCSENKPLTKLTMFRTGIL